MERNLTAKRKCHVLGAVEPEVQEALSHALGEKFDLAFIARIPDIDHIDPDELDVVLCTVQFDESQVFELIRYVKLSAHLQHLPIAVLRLEPGRLEHSAIAMVMKTVALLGVNACVDLHEWQQRLGRTEAYRRLQAVIHTLCASGQHRRIAVAADHR